MTCNSCNGCNSQTVIIHDSSISPTIHQPRPRRLHQECQNALNKTKESEAIIAELNCKAEKWEAENSRLLADNADMKLELENSVKIHTELNQKLEEMKIDRDAAVANHEEEKGIAEELRTINSQLQNEREAIQLEVEAIKGELST